MTYATLQDMIDEFSTTELVQLTDRADEPTGEVDVAVLGKALEKADAEINSYIAARYALPLATVPSRLVSCAADIARYFLYKDVVTDAVRARYKDAIAWLRDVQAGRAALDLGTADAVPAAGGVTSSSSDRVFTRDSLSDYNR